MTRRISLLLVALVCSSLLVIVRSDEDVVVGEEEESGGGGGGSEGRKTEGRPVYKPPSRPTGDVYLEESFTDSKAVKARWIKSKAKKDGADADIAKYDGKWELTELETDGALDGDIGLVMSQAAKHYAIAAKLDRPFTFQGTESLVVQYEVNFQNGLSCGGAYLKLLSDDADSDLSKFNDQTPYSIMFGPDKCGMSSKVHFIIRFRNPLTGEVEEKHSKQSDESKDFFDDKKTHLFTLLIHSDNTYHIVIDQRPFLKGNLLEDLTPSIVPDKEIDDPDDKMPADWDEREKIPDPTATKPDDWDEDAPPKIPDPDAVKPDGWLDDGPEFVPDPDAEQPDDWDEEEDGEWEPPMIPNPACESVGCGEWTRPMIQNPSYKGKWKAPMIDNPDYDGKWAPRKIENPAYFDDETPYYSLSPITAVGFELWSMSENIYFDNILIASELAIANNYAKEGWNLKYESERGSMSLGGFLDGFVELANNYPYMWALYAVAIALPFVLCACCCVRSKPSKPKKDEAAERKKTDAPSPDDPKAKEEDDEQSKSEEKKKDGDSQKKKKGEEPKVESSVEEQAEEETGKGPEDEESEGEGEGGEGEGEGEGEGGEGEDDGDEGSQGEENQEEGGEEEDDADVEDEEPASKTKARKRARARRED